MQGSNRFERRRNAPLDLLPRQPHVGRAESHILFDSGHEELVVGVLENQPDALPHQPEGLGRDGDAAYHNLSRGGQQQPVGMEQQGRFACAVGPDERGFLAVREPERHPAQGFVSVGVAVMHAVELQEMMAHGAVSD